MKNKQTLFMHGAIAGIALVASWFIVGIFTKGKSPDFAMGEIIGYAAMILALSLVYFGVKSYRDNQRNGSINFREAFVNGLVIVLVASIIYVIGWEIYYPNFMPDFAGEYSAQQMANLSEEGDLTPTELEEKRAEMEAWMNNYKNPLIRMPITFLEIFPVGMIIALFTALILKKRPA